MIKIYYKKQSKNVILCSIVDAGRGSRVVVFVSRKCNCWWAGRTIRRSGWVRRAWRYVPVRSTSTVTTSAAPKCPGSTASSFTHPSALPVAPSPATWRWSGWLDRFKGQIPSVRSVSSLEALNTDFALSPDGRLHAPLLHVRILSVFTYCPNASNASLYTVIQVALLSQRGRAMLRVCQYM